VVALDNPPRLVIDVAARPGAVPLAPPPEDAGETASRVASVPPPATVRAEEKPRPSERKAAEEEARSAPAPAPAAVTPSPSRAGQRKEQRAEPAAAAPMPGEERRDPRRAAEPSSRAEPPPAFESVPHATLDRREPPPEPPRVEMPEQHLAELDAEPSPVPTARPQRAAPPPPPLAPRAPWRIVLDPGHGGNDPGARGIDGILEKDVTLTIAAMLKTRLEKELNATVLLTREGDATRTLAERTAFANASRADLFISIHANADDAGKLRGIETYTLNNSNDRATIRLAKMENGPHLRVGRGDLSFILSDMVQSSKEEESIALAERVHSRLLARLRARYPDVRNLGVKKGPFYVLVGAYMPCVLIETSFLSHPVEGKRLASEEYQADIAEGLFLGVRDFLDDARLAKTL
jgi:N-acetylmuramoyl-L-alanine amidase